MRTRNAWMFALAMLLALALGLAACGGGSTNNAGTSSAGTGAGGTHQDVAADRAAAEAASLRLSDFPTGWMSKPASGGTSSTAEDARLAKCLGVNESELSDSPVSHTSPNFEMHYYTVASTVGYRATAAEQNAAFEVWSNPKMPQCLGSSLAAVAKQEAPNEADATVGTPTVTASGPAGTTLPQFGDKSIGYEIMIPLCLSSNCLPFYVNVIAVIKGRADVGIMIASFVAPFPPSDAEHYTGLVVGRLTRTS